MIIAASQLKQPPGATRTPVAIELICVCDKSVLYSWTLANLHKFTDAKECTCLQLPFALRTGNYPGLAAAVTPNRRRPAAPSFFAPSIDSGIGPGHSSVLPKPEVERRAARKSIVFARGADRCGPAAVERRGARRPTDSEGYHHPSARGEYCCRRSHPAVWQHVDLGGAARLGVHQKKGNAGAV